MFPADLLRRLRNDLPMRITIAALDREGPPSKIRDGRFVFLCPACGEMLVAVNPRNNLAHCFACQRNFNNLDLLLALDYDFRSAVALLEGWLNQHLARRSQNRTTEAK
jgi:hypothetical protein